MYLKDKNHRITLRLNDNQFEFIRINCDVLGVSPSDYLRMRVNSFMTISQAGQDAVKKTLEERTDAGRENDEARIDDIV